MCFRCGADSGRTSNRWRSPAVVLPFPLTELSLLKPLAMCNPPPPKPCPTTPGTYVQTQGRIGAEARKAPVVSLRLAQPAPSWGGSLKARQVWARLAPSRAASRWELCQIGSLSRARDLPYWRPTYLRISRAFRLTGLGCLLFPRGGSLPCWLCSRLSGGGAGLLQQFLGGLESAPHREHQAPRAPGWGFQPRTHGG